MGKYMEGIRSRGSKLPQDSVPSPYTEDISVEVLLL